MKESGVCLESLVEEYTGEKGLKEANQQIVREPAFDQKLFGRDPEPDRLIWRCAEVERKQLRNI